jgi:sugar phosphate isomerase/epimerase
VAGTLEQPRVLASTTSHKREPLLPTLEVFAHLGLRDIDLNLHHVLEEAVPVEVVAEAAAAYGLRIWIASGGWCDFFHPAPRAAETDRSVDHQVDIARRLGARQLRLFFGRLKFGAYSSAARDVAAANIQRLADRHPDMLFNFENHDGASLHPEVCAEVFAAVGRGANVRMNFDPINFERAGVSSRAAVDLVHPFVGHVHLKGLDAGEFCEFGAGDVDLVPILEQLGGYGYRGGFSVEYEGPHDGTLRLYESVNRARAVVSGLTV